eukprot:CAMPEP_0203744646 /NCGR_PEP_ID=MMETSP0098-20131031/647_1 /ASSEMBLY_ACC=CAM_ASM_000208 /TAXON_ID=96639 /ORGANISM=" , Strain NY0313808BC1" /LENGTH=3064 /DNA_ID=CAMNT_0050632223 /DNA_START=56 /DNA_END=9247 /DNA_ORIENTATION=-
MGNARSQRLERGCSSGDDEQGFDLFKSTLDRMGSSAGDIEAMKTLAIKKGSKIVHIGFENGLESQVFCNLFEVEYKAFESPLGYVCLLRYFLLIIHENLSRTDRDVEVIWKAAIRFCEDVDIVSPESMYSEIFAVCATILGLHVKSLEKKSGTKTEPQLKILALCVSFVLHTCLDNDFRDLKSIGHGRSCLYFETLSRKFVPALVDGIRVCVFHSDGCSLFQNVLEALTKAVAASLHRICTFYKNGAFMKWFCSDTDGLALILDVVAGSEQRDGLFLDAFSILALCGSIYGPSSYSDANLETILMRTKAALRSMNQTSVLNIQLPESQLPDVPHICVGAGTKILPSVYCLEPQASISTLSMVAEMKTSTGHMPVDDDPVFQNLHNYLERARDPRTTGIVLRGLVSEFQATSNLDLKQKIVHLANKCRFNLGELYTEFPDFVIKAQHTALQLEWMQQISCQPKLDLMVEACNPKYDFSTVEDFVVLVAHLLITVHIPRMQGDTIDKLVDILGMEDMTWTKVCCSLAIIDAMTRQDGNVGLTVSDPVLERLLKALFRIGFLNENETRQAVIGILSELLYLFSHAKRDLGYFFLNLREVLGNRYANSEHPDGNCFVFFDMFQSIDDVTTLEWVWFNGDISAELVHFVDAYSQRTCRLKTALCTMRTLTSIFAHSDEIKDNARRSGRYSEYGSLLKNCSSTKDDLVKALSAMFEMMFDGRRTFSYREKNGFATCGPSKIVTNPDALCGVLVLIFDIAEQWPTLFDHVLQVIQWLVFAKDGEVHDAKQRFMLAVCEEENISQMVAFSANDPMIDREETCVNATAFSQIEQSLILQLLEGLYKFEQTSQDRALLIISSLGRSYMSVRHLKAMFRQIWKVSEGSSSRLTERLVKSINTILEGGRSHFYFTSIDSGLHIYLGPSNEEENSTGSQKFNKSHLEAAAKGNTTTWPSEEALSFAAWINLHSTCNPGTVFQLSTKRMRYSCKVFVQNNTLRIATVFDDEKQDFDSSFEIAAKEWFHLAFVAKRSKVPGFLTSSYEELVQLFVNGKPVFKHECKFPFSRRDTQHNIDSWTVGVNANAEERLHGSLGSIQFWFAPLSAKDVTSLHVSPTRQVNPDKLALRLDVHSARCASGKTFLDTSPNAKQRFGGLVPFAYSGGLPGTRKCLCRGARRAMMAVGGMYAVFPILALEVNGELSGCALYLVGNMLSNGKALLRSQNSIRDGISVVGYLLGRLSPECIDENTLRGALFLVKQLSSDWLLYHHGIHQLFFGLNIWRGLSPKVLTAVMELCDRSVGVRKLVGLSTIVNELFVRNSAQSVTLQTRESLDITSPLSPFLRSQSTITEMPTTSVPSDHVEFDRGLPKPEASCRDRVRAFHARMLVNSIGESPNAETVGSIITLLEASLNVLNGPRLSREELDAFVTILSNMPLDDVAQSPMFMALILNVAKREPRGLVHALGGFAARDFDDVELQRSYSEDSAMDVENADFEDDRLSRKSSISSISSVSGTINISLELFMIFLASDVCSVVTTTLQILRLLIVRKAIKIPTSAFEFIADLLFLGCSKNLTEWDNGDSLWALCDYCYTLAISPRSKSALSSADALRVLIAGPLRAAKCEELKKHYLSTLEKLLASKLSCDIVLRLKGWQILFLGSMCAREMEGCLCVLPFCSIFDTLHTHDLFKVALEAAKRPDKFKEPACSALEQTLECLKQSPQHDYLGCYFVFRALDLVLNSIGTMKDHYKLTVGHQLVRLFSRVLGRYCEPFNGFPLAALCGTTQTDVSDMLQDRSPCIDTLNVDHESSCRGNEPNNTYESVESEEGSNKRTEDTWVRVVYKYMQLLELLHVSPLQKSGKECPCRCCTMKLELEHTVAAMLCRILAQDSTGYERGRAIGAVEILVQDGSINVLSFLTNELPQEFDHILTKIDSRMRTLEKGSQPSISPSVLSRSPVKASPFYLSAVATPPVLQIDTSWGLTTAKHQVVSFWLRNILNATKLLNERERNQRDSLFFVYNHADRLSGSKWKNVLNQVTHERGTWGEGKSYDSRFYKLDFCETSRTRSRIRIKRNMNGTDHKDASENSELKGKQNVAKTDEAGELESDAEHGFQKMNLFNELQRARALGSSFVPSTRSTRDLKVETKPESFRSPSSPASPLIATNPTVAGSIQNMKIPIVAPKDAHISMLPIAPTQGFSANATMIFPSESATGKFEVGKHVIKFIRECSQGRPDGSIGLGKKWGFNSIRRVQMRRYMMRWTALELFTGLTERKSYLVNFESSQKCAAAIKLIAKAIKQDNALLSPVERAYRSGAQQDWIDGRISNFEYIMILNDMASRSYLDLAQYPIFPWVLCQFQGEDIDLQNESVYRDLNYPIGAQSTGRRDELRTRFVETKKNYNALNFQNQGQHSSPINLLFKWRNEKQSKKEAKHGDENVLQGPPWHFGSHYSSRAIVLWYMLRLEPFTSLHIELQGGRFDHADRQFESIQRAYDFGTMISPRELIPEFFCNPEFLRNSSKFDLGTKQDGTKLGDVKLPPWAKNSPELFIKIHREALESDHVSANLHHWIDLTFGYKQMGSEAEEALNVYFHLMYEGAVDLEYLETIRPDLFRTVLRMVEEYGQSPPVLFSQPHPQRRIKVPRPLSPLKVTCTTTIPLRDSVYKGGVLWISPEFQLLDSSSSLFTKLKFTKKASSNRCFLYINSKRILGLVHVVVEDNTGDESGKDEVLRTKVTTICELGAPFAFEEGIGPHMFACRIADAKDLVGLGVNHADFAGVLDGVKFESPTPFSPTTSSGISSGTFAAHDNVFTIFASGFWDSSFRSTCVDISSKLIPPPDHDQLLLGSCGKQNSRYRPDGVFMSHSDLTTCVCLTEDGSYLLTGSMDCCVFVWRVLEVDEKKLLQLENVLLGHDDIITCVAASSSLDLVFSASLDGSCIIHTLEHGSYLLSVHTPSPSEGILPNALRGGFASNLSNGWMWVGIASTLTPPVLNIWREEDLSLYAYSVNGRLISRRKWSTPMYAFVYSYDQKYLACATKQKVVQVFDTYTLELVSTSSSFDPTSVVSISSYADEYSFFVGLQDGFFAVLTLD